jgi:hypothetical protein
MRTHTYGTALALAGVTVPDHLIADAEVPVLTGPQAQGDLMVVPVAGIPTDVNPQPVTAAGAQVVHGEATGNTHWLHAGFDSPGVAWARVDAGQVVGYAVVPAGQTAQLIHTDEHGSNGIGPGAYEIRRKREMADSIRQVAD